MTQAGGTDPTPADAPAGRAVPPGIPLTPLEAAARGRTQHWPGAFNARELGGIAVTGGRIRHDVLFRSGQPETWSPAGAQAARAAGVERIIDLRDPREPRGAPPDDGPPREFTPIEDPDDPAFRARFVPYLNHPGGYADFLGMFPELVGRAVRRVIDAGPGTVICCSAGRDRTGLVTGLLLAGLGAAPSTLADEDELATRAVNERHRTRETPHPYESFQRSDDLAAAVASRRRAVVAFFSGLDAAAFLRDHGAEVDRARSWLVEPAS